MILKALNLLDNGERYNFLALSGWEWVPTFIWSLSQVETETLKALKLCDTLTNYCRHEKAAHWSGTKSSITFSTLLTTVCSLVRLWSWWVKITCGQKLRLEPTKIGHEFRKQMFQKLKLSKMSLVCSIKIIFLKDSVDSWHWKVTLKVSLKDL